MTRTGTILDGSRMCEGVRAQTEVSTAVTPTGTCC